MYIFLQTEKCELTLFRFFIEKSFQYLLQIFKVFISANHYSMRSFLLLLCVACISIQCTSKKKEKTNTAPIASAIKYAKGFNIIEENGQKILIINKPFYNTDKVFRYTLSNKTNLSKNTLKVPLQKFVVTSTTHIPMLELLNTEDRLIGFPHTKYISSEKTRRLVENGHITELGNEQSMNTEKLLDLEPELVVGFSLNANNKTYSNIQKLGIPVLYHGGWLEETPLGRAEWIKFFGVLTGKEKAADSIFKVIENNYLSAKTIAQKNTQSPTILSGSLFKDVWNVPAGESFIATFLKDANLNYLWKDTKGTGSLSLSFESVLEKGKNADYWIGSGLYASKEQLLKSNANYTEFDAVHKNRVYSIGKRRGPTGGLIYFELAPVRPDLVLKDLIKITNPKLLPDYELNFFDQLK